MPSRQQSIVGSRRPALHASMIWIAESGPFGVLPAAVTYQEGRSLLIPLSSLGFPPRKCAHVPRTAYRIVVHHALELRMPSLELPRYVLGCSRKGKNGATTSKTKTVLTTLETRIPNSKRCRSNQPGDGWAIGVRKKTGREALDRKGSFREVPPAVQGLSFVLPQQNSWVKFGSGRLPSV